MKNIMIGEGTNDSTFSNNLLCILNYKTKIFNQKSVSKDEKKHQETVELRRFIQKSSPYNFLFKSEGGKDMAAKLFAAELYFLLDTKDISKTILMLDVDEDVNSKLEKIKDIIIKKQRSGEKLSINFNNVAKISKDGVNCIYFYEANLIKEENEEILGRFYLVLFNRDLEEVANRYYPSQELSEKEKIIKLAKDREIKNKFYQFLK